MKPDQTPSQFPVIEFVNHASIWLGNGRIGVLTDPWLFGDVFHHGWSLLVENDDAYIRSLIERTDFIWLSHEHPDHFSPPFFRRYLSLLQARGIKVLFQQTRDGRVAAFFKSLGIPVIELPNGRRMQLAERFEVRIVKSDLYDSALLAEIDGCKVFNLNDCPLHSQAGLEKFVAQYGGCDLLLTQFSYAAWKGGRENLAWRKRAARHKLQAMARQIDALQPRACLAFASFVRFSNVHNAYMNDAINRPEHVLASEAARKTQIIFMRPGESQAISAIATDEVSMRYWNDLYDGIPFQPLLEFGTSVPEAALVEAYGMFMQEISSRNNLSLMKLAQALPFLHPFKSVSIRLADTGSVVIIDPVGGLKIQPEGACDVELHSRSLAFMLRNEFGFDTLFVNGCFEELREGGFDALAACFAIRNLNAAGIYIGFGLLRQIAPVLALLKKRIAVQRNLAKKQARKV